MSIESRISAIYDLGQFFHFLTENESNNNRSDNTRFESLKNEFEYCLKSAEIKNPWFTQDNLKFCLTQWAELLTINNLKNWKNNYPTIVNPKNIGIVMAGNIPLVGLHDLLSVLVSGHDAIVKTSSKDDVLMSWVINFLQNADEELKNSIQKVEKLQNQDAVIATGSNNTARYFEYYFKDIPHIIRKNRTSIAVLTGNETSEDLQKLAEDIFRYFGLGCRNVTKLYLPKGFDTNLLFESFFSWKHLIDHAKYANNYEYNRAIYLMGNETFLDNNFVMLKESNEFFSPIGVLNYNFYDNLDKVKDELAQNEEKIQCVVSNESELFKQSVKFGDTQKPSLKDYADGIDTMKFLGNL